MRAAASNSARLAHRRTPVDPEPATGLTTNGRPISVAAVTAASAEHAAANLGPGRPAWVSLARCVLLSRQDRTASGSGCGRPSDLANSPATAMKYSELLVTPAIGPPRRPHAASTASAAAVSATTLSI